jgi:hypothetical protein
VIARPSQIDAVIVCVNYADFLAETLPHNLPQLDSVTVVTDHDDHATQALCKRLDVQCLKTDVMYRDQVKPAFNKARAINHGLAHMGLDHWVIHLDADIALPPHWRKAVINADLDTKNIHGWDRVNVHGGEEWDKIRLSGSLQDEWSCFVHFPGGQDVGSRIRHGDYAGWLPIGFAQLWNPRGSEVWRYPVKPNSDMEHTDVLHAAQWERARRVLLGESILYHLVSPDLPKGDNGTNWSGRKSGPFRPPHHHHHHDHNHHHHPPKPKPYCP